MTKSKNVQLNTTWFEDAQRYLKQNRIEWDVHHLRAIGLCLVDLVLAHENELADIQSSHQKLIQELINSRIKIDHLTHGLRDEKQAHS